MAGSTRRLAKGFYKAHGLDVTIRMGGPQTNPPQQVALGLVDVQISSGSFAAMALAQQGIPVVAVAAFFQKDPQVLISHPRHRQRHHPRDEGQADHDLGSQPHRILAVPEGPVRLPPKPRSGRTTSPSYRSWPTQRLSRKASSPPSPTRSRKRPG